MAVAGICNKEGSDDGVALSSTLEQWRGHAVTQDRTIYWLEFDTLRRIKDGVITTVPLTNPERSKDPYYDLWRILFY